MIQPARVLLPRLDTFGDIILLQGFLEELAREWPGTEFHLLVRTPYLELRSLWPNPVHWRGTAMEPRSVLPRALRDDDDVVGLLAEKWDLLLDTTFNRGWLEEELASAFQAHGIKCIRIADAAGPAPTNDRISTAFVPAGVHETSKYEILFEYLTGRSVRLPKPRLVVPEDAARRSDQLITDAGLTAGKFAVCVPGGGLNNPIKLWRARGFAECIRHLELRYGIPTLIAGHQLEEGVLEETRRAALGLGASPILWVGRSSQLDVLAGLLERSGLYIGNDTGPMHMSQAVGTPVVAVFGGGHWPRFAPAGPAIVCMSPQPCYGCDWHCMFGHALCIDAVAEEDVLKAIDRMLAGTPEDCEVIECGKGTDLPKSIWRQASEHFVTISRKAAVLPFVERDLNSLMERDRESQSLIQTLHTAAKAGTDEIEQVRAVAGAAEVRMQASIAALQSECDLTLGKLRDLQEIRQNEADSLQSRIAALQTARDHLLDDLASVQQQLEESRRESEILREETAALKKNIEQLTLRAEEAELACKLAQGDLQLLSRRLQQAQEETAASLARLREDPFEWLVQSSSTEPKTIRCIHVAEPKLVSVIIPVYNGVAFLEQSVRSVWQQEPGDYRLEILVCDDGSSDGSKSLAEALAQQSPVPMQVLRHEGGSNRGVSATRNLGLTHARGEFIALLDADDVWLPSKTVRQLAYFAEHPEAESVCSFGHNRNTQGEVVKGWTGSEFAGDYRHVTPPDDFTPPYTFHQLLKGDPVVNSTVMIRRAAVERVGGYSDVMAHQAEDWLLFLKLTLTSPIHLISEPLIDYTIHPGSYTTQYFTHGLAYGAQIECMFQLLHWMLQSREHAMRARWVYRRMYPRLMAGRGAGYRLLETYYMAHNGTSTGVESFEAHLTGLYHKLERYEFLDNYYQHIEAQLNLLRRMPGLTHGYHVARAIWRRLQQWRSAV